MSANKVDIVFVVDASGSMSSCFEKLKEHLRKFIEPLIQASFDIRFGLVAYHTHGSQSHQFIGGGGSDLVRELYDAQVNEDKYFTTDANVFLNALDKVETEGDENTPLALDIAGDFPFQPLDVSRRVIALFSDEPLEGGSDTDTYLPKLNRVLKKIVKRKIAVYSYLPASQSATMLSRLPKSIMTSVPGGSSCWESIDFAGLMEQMGKSISVSALQMSTEPPYEKAIYGQDA